MRKSSFISGLFLSFFFLTTSVFAQENSSDTAPRGYRTNAAGCVGYFSGWTYPLDFTWTGDCREMEIDGEVRNMIVGRGKLKIRRRLDGRLEQDYDGETKNGRYDGWGWVTYHYGDGSKSEYIGQWINDQKQGFGKETLSDGDVYTGDFRNDRYHGQGIYVWKDGESRYEGQWKNGLRDGQGVLILNSTNDCCSCEIFAKYVGSFKDDVFHGRGIMYDRDGKVIRRGLWFKGEPYKGSEAQWRRDDENRQKKNPRRK